MPMASRPTQEPALPVSSIGRPEGVPQAARPRIGPADDGRALTLQEFLEADEEPGYRYELARGVLEVTEVPDDLHRQVMTNLYEAMARYRRDHPGVILSYGGG